ncbi:magnesium/cobalt efflux protein CorC [Halolamina pelagica]|uniref:Magnesium/cobalt efflux protein CorC n=1 Tax=Halolamina pelagica TaxID=699431 RepID=A0A0P7I4T5_9EURY|nr:magnesium/cobalt efflux protein CorC [Halolamina pelagica]
MDVAEVAMIERVFELDDTAVREVMVPLPDVISVPADATLSDLRETVFEWEHTRYPVVSTDDATQIAGFVDVKDVLRASETDHDGETTAGDLAREVLVVPETTTINDLLLQFQADNQQMAAVIDEWGAFEGMATVEDVVEAVVGDLRDEFDAADREHSIRQGDAGEFEVDGGVTLSAVNDALGTELDHEAVETIAGLILSHLDRAPERGDSVAIDGYEAEVTGVDGTRIETVRIYERADDETSEDGN